MLSRTVNPLALWGCVWLASALLAQSPAAPKAGTDVLLFPDGEKLIGELKSATDTAVVFQSDMGFEVTVAWSKIQELKSDKKFAAIHKALTVSNAANAAAVPVGTVEMKDQKLAVASAPQPTVLPLKDLSNVVSQQSFNRALKRKNFLGGWKGGFTGGLSLTEATVSTRTLNAAVDLTRQDTSESWLPVRNRTTFGLSFYNELTVQPYAANTKTSILHSDFVHDMYFTPRLFGFAGATFDHNYNQGLNLLQGYGGGIGVVAKKTKKGELDFRAGLGYMRQDYTDRALNQNLIGSRFNENYTRTFAHGITLYEQAGIRPAWNNMKNYFTGFLVDLNVPVYRRVSLNLDSFDSYVNNPPPFRKKNTFQATVGLHFTLFK